MEKLGIFFTVILLLPAGWLSASGNLPEKFDTQFGFSISLPAGWVEIPEKTVTEYAENINSTLDTEIPIKYDYGFQSGTGDTWFAYPFILLQVDAEGKIAESTFVNELGGSIEEITDVKDDYLLDQIQIGTPQYDNKTYTMWSHNKTTLAFGTVHNFSAMILTEKGFVSIHSYMMEEQVASFFPVFQDIIKNIRFDEWTKYDPTKFNLGVFIATLTKDQILLGIAGLFFILIIVVVLTMKLILFLFRSKPEYASRKKQTLKITGSTVDEAPVRTTAHEEKLEENKVEKPAPKKPKASKPKKTKSKTEKDAPMETKNSKPKKTKETPKRATKRKPAP